MNEEAPLPMPGTSLRRNTSDNSNTQQEPMTRPPPPAYPPVPPQPQYPHLPPNLPHGRPMPPQPIYGQPNGLPLVGQQMPPHYMYPMAPVHHMMPPGQHPAYYMNHGMNRPPGQPTGPGLVENTPTSAKTGSVFSKILDMVKKK